MPDISIVWDVAAMRGDWQMVGAQLATGNDLYTAMLVSLFSDRIASADFVPPDGSTDLRGWWADSYTGDPIGSRLWQLMRAKKVGQTTLLRQAEDFCQEALQWLLDDGVVATMTINAFWLNGTALGIAITVTQPGGNTSRLAVRNIAGNWQWVWDQV